MPGNVEENGAETSDAASDHDRTEGDSIQPTALHDDEDDEKMDMYHTSPEASGASAPPTKKYDPKDPQRPRRKKARRACFACQRAHLTCGDERPCLRCVKRGLAEACQDGIRKKAKYLHDAPPEALGPVLGPNYNPNAVARSPSGRHPSNATSEASSFFQQPDSSPSFPLYTGNGHNPPSNTGTEVLPYANQQSPVSPGFQPINGSQSMNGGQLINGSQPINRDSQMSGLSVQPPTQLSQFQEPMFDPSNPALYNFDLEGVTFGSEYGALEFGMLGHMSSGAAETPTNDAMAPQSATSDMSFNPAAMFSNGSSFQPYNNGMNGNFVNMDSTINTMFTQGNLQHGLPHAYAVPAVGPTPNSLDSPGTDNTASPQTIGYDNSPNAAHHPVPPGQQGQDMKSHAVQQAQKLKRKRRRSHSSIDAGPLPFMTKHVRDPTSIYENIREPYPYLTGFHNLISLIGERFDHNQNLRIAKSLARIRPSFMACTHTLNRADLVFMEKCLQRALFEYEEFMGLFPTPTVVCRRTGEVVAVNKEFVALTGWTKEVLLGKAPNKNVNIGRTGTATNAASSDQPEMLAPTPKKKGRLGQPNPQEGEQDQQGQKPGQSQGKSVFVAELMDPESVCQFYDDFSRLSFNDSRGRAVHDCDLLKYRTKETQDRINAMNGPEPPPQRSPQSKSLGKDPRGSILSNRVTRIDGEHGISKLERAGKVHCMGNWSVKLDVFGIPMLLTLNFLPRYDHAKDQHLAV